VISFSQLEIVILEELKAAGERGRTVSRSDVAQLSRLVNMGYVKIRAGTTKGTQFVISARGLNALAELMSSDHLDPIGRSEMKDLLSDTENA
jgi:hypothetical protein